MSQAKQELYYKLVIEGLSAANRGSVFWSKSDAFSSLNLVRASS